MLHNLFVFHGADHKVGTTMISQSVAETISDSDPNLKVLYLALNGRGSTEYIRMPTVSIDSMKNLISNKMINRHDFLRTCRTTDRFYMLAGILNELEERHYLPEMATYLLEEVSPEFDLVIADCGNTPDNGLAAGALQASGRMFYLITQQESVLNRCEKQRELYSALGVTEIVYLVNKYRKQEPYSVPYIGERLGIEKNLLCKIAASDYSGRAEIDHKTLIGYRDEGYFHDILSVANLILEKTGRKKAAEKRRFRWKSFI